MVGTDISPIQPTWIPPNLKLCVDRSDSSSTPRPLAPAIPMELFANIAPSPLSSEIEDCTREWTFAANSVDYVHLRWLVGSISDWNSLFAEAYRVCRPGGWVESLEGSCFVESDHCDLPDSSALGQWSKFFVEGGKHIGRTFLVLEEELQKKGMEAAGFVDIQETNFKVSECELSMVITESHVLWPEAPRNMAAGSGL